MIKICHYGASDSGGGVANYINTIKENSLTNRFDHETIKERARGGLFVPSNYSLLQLPIRVIQLIDYISIVKPRILHAHTCRAGLIAGLARLLRRRLKLVYTGHGVTHIHKGSAVQRCAWKIAERFIHKVADKSIFISSHECNTAISSNITNRPKSIVIHTRINDIAQDIGLNQRENGIVSVGSVDERKNPKQFIRIAISALAINPNLKFTWIGGGPLLEQCQDTIKNLNLTREIVFTGPIAHESIWPIMGSSKIYLSTSYLETVPLGILEAMSARLVPVCLYYPGLNEIIRNGINGICIPDRSTDDAAGQIVNLISEEAHMRKLAANARRTFEKKYSSPAILARQYQDVYHRLFSSHPNVIVQMRS